MKWREVFDAIWTALLFIIAVCLVMLVGIAVEERILKERQTVPAPKAHLRLV